MGEPQKPFACSVADCGMTFTNEDHLHVHSKKHDMVLQLGLDQKAAFVADQTPTPTRFIRNCEEVGLFQEIQHVAENPFDEGFKKAMETKQGILCLENVIAASVSDDVLHTPQMVFTLDSDSAMFSSGQRHITISRSSSDESGTVKASATISRLSNEITISRTVSKEALDKVTTEDTTIVKNTDNVGKNETIYSKNVIKTIIKDNTKMIVASKDVLLTDVNKLQVPEKQQIMSQKSLDYVVDSLTSEMTENETVKHKDAEAGSERKLIYVKANVSKTISTLETPSEAPVTKIVPENIPKLMPKPRKTKKINRVIPALIDFNKLPLLEPKPAESLCDGDIEVMIKLPNGKRVKMKAVHDKDEPNNKQIIKNKLIAKNRYLLNANEKQSAQKEIGNTVSPNKNSTFLNNQVKSMPELPSRSNITNTSAANKTEAPTTNTVIKNTTPVYITNDINGKIPIIITSDGKTHLPAILTNGGHIIIPENNTNTLPDKIKSTPPINNKNTTVDPKSDNEQEKERTETVEHKNLVRVEESHDIKRANGRVQRSKYDLESRSAASKRYRDRLRQQMSDQQLEIKALREANQRLTSEKAALKQLVTLHMKTCPNAEELSKCRHCGHAYTKE